MVGDSARTLVVASARYTAPPSAGTITISNTEMSVLVTCNVRLLSPPQAAPQLPSPICSAALIRNELATVSFVPVFEMVQVPLPVSIPLAICPSLHPLPKSSDQNKGSSHPPVSSTTA